MNENRLKPRQANDELIFNISRKENLNIIKIIKNDKINEKKTTSKIAKDRLKKKYLPYKEPRKFAENEELEETFVKKKKNRKQVVLHKELDCKNSIFQKNPDLM